MVEPITSPWRLRFSELLASARRDLIIACPFIKTPEAQWVCERLTAAGSISRLRLRVMTDVRADSVLNGSLDVEALCILAGVVPNSTVVNLPRLHAKVYVADEQLAIVGSGNLTPAGLDSNFEYGVALTDPAVVHQVRGDLEAYARVGNELAPQALTDLASVATGLADEYQRLQRSTSASLRKRFNRTLRSAEYEFLRAQVGSRSANSLFSEALVYVLRKGPLTTRELHPAVQRLLPDLCDDNVDRVINGEHFGKRWKHAVRSAQQHLKRNGVISFDGRRWSLVAPAPRSG